MRFVSTRGQTPPQSFSDILLSGLAPDGGLFAPDAWPKLTRDEIGAFAGQSYEDAAFAILRRFIGDNWSDADLKEDIAAAYKTFETPEIAPLVPLGHNQFLMELFHGPTLAFKDVAMQLLGRLFSRALGKRGGKATVVVATSGDTGSAAIAALGDLPNITLFVIHPKGRVSEVQRLQMTTAPFANVHNIALEGTFDDAQNIVKQLFADVDFAKPANLTAVNSINFARIAAQCIYYFTATAKLGNPCTFVVPTGNFGDIFAGEAAMHMGLDVERLVIATNANDILARALNDGDYASGIAHHTLSPSMDIQVASNFERALFEAAHRDTHWTRAAMAEFAKAGRLQIPESMLARLRERYSATHCDDEATLNTIARIHRDLGRIIDPHTAVAVEAATRLGGRGGAPVVILSTAHPAKFPDAVKRATGEYPPLPPRLAGLYDGQERVTVLPHGAAAVRSFIEHTLERA